MQTRLDNWINNIFLIKNGNVKVPVCKFDENAHVFLARDSQWIKNVFGSIGPNTAVPDDSS